MPPQKQPPLDRDWFFQRLEASNKSVRGMARHLGLDPSAMSRMLSGKRRMKMEEATDIAAFIGAPVAEVLKHAGISVEAEISATPITLAATINRNGQIEPLAEPSPLPQAVAIRARATIPAHSGKIVAAQVRALDGPLIILDDAVVLYSESDKIEPQASGVLSICRLKNGNQFIARLERSRKTGEASVICVDGTQREFVLESATPILAIIT